MSLSNELYAALRQKGIELLEMDEKPKQLRLIGRLHKNYGDQWKLVMHRLLTAETDAPWKVDVSKKYFLRGGKVFYGWRLVFQAENLAQFYPVITKVVQATPLPSRVTVEEVPLLGVSPDRSTRTNVGGVGQVAIGPLALQRKLAGG